jgi:serine/threonine protein kinase
LKELDIARREFCCQCVGIRDEKIRVPAGNALLDVSRVRESLREFDRVQANLQSASTAAESLKQLIRTIGRTERLPRAALKELLPIDEAVNAKTAIERMKRELEAMRAVNHPSLIKVIDENIIAENLGRHWYVTEYYPGGTLATRLETFCKNRVLDYLEAFRPLVEAVAKLHQAGVVHRDIKPDNVFVDDNDHLVLGDCGLAFKMEQAERLTETFENVGTRDYQPGWSYGMRLQDVKPTFDVFSLGKLLWAMVSGRPRFPLWYLDQEAHDLRTHCPDPQVRFVHRLLTGSVVQWEKDLRFQNAAELLEAVEETIAAISAGAQVPTQKRAMRCRFCGLGEYAKRDNFDVSGNMTNGLKFKWEHYVCGNCGHLESFVWGGENRPPAWAE